MKQFPLRTFQEVKPNENQQNLSPLKSSSKLNMQFLKNYKLSKDSFKDSQNLTDHELLQKLLKTYEETISRQKVEIQTLKQQVEGNRQYTTALEEKYTILLQSIQPFQEKVNIEILLNKIIQLENRLQSVPKGQTEATSFKFLRLTQKSTSINSDGPCSQNFDQLPSDSEKFILPTPISSANSLLNRIFSKIQEKETVIQNSITKRQEKLRKQSTDSDVGVQVCFFQQYNAPIKINNIEKFIPLESQMKNNEINLSRKRKNSQYEENLSSVWEKLINEHLNHDEALSTKFKHKTEHLLKKCVPYELRSTVWPMVFENPLGITWQFYMQLIQSRSKGWVDQGVKIQIQKDLNRSFTGKGKELQNKDKLIDQVQQVLELFHLYRPDVSYVQGMTYPAIVLTTVVGKMKAFCILANQIIGIPFYKRLYTFQGQYPSIYCRTFDYLLKDVNSGVYDMLQRKHISSQLFLIEWFYTFFSRGLNFESTLKIWDHMAYFGESTIFRLAVTVIELVSGYLNDATYEGAIGLIKEFSSYIDDKKLIEAFTNSKVTDERYRKAFRKAVKSFQS